MSHPPVPLASQSMCSGGLAVEVSVCLWFPEVTSWDPGKVCHCCAIIPGLWGSWLYDIILGFVSSERLRERIKTLCGVSPMYVGRKAA